MHVSNLSRSCGTTAILVTKGEAGQDSSSLPEFGCGVCVGQSTNSSHWLDPGIDESCLASHHVSMAAKVSTCRAWLGEGGYMQQHPMKVGNGDELTPWLLDFSHTLSLVQSFFWTKVREYREYCGTLYFRTQMQGQLCNINQSCVNYVDKKKLWLTVHSSFIL